MPQERWQTEELGTIFISSAMAPTPSVTFMMRLEDRYSVMLAEAWE